MEVETQALSVATAITGIEVLDWTEKRQLAERTRSSPSPPDCGHQVTWLL